MRLKHKFIDEYDSREIIDDPSERLILGDYCVNCNLIVGNIISNIFEKEQADLTTRNFKISYDNINELYPCITDEEFLIKKALE